jgi:hypothetical protein
MNGRRLLFGVAAGLAGLTAGAGIAAAQSDEDTGTQDTVVEQDSTTDSTPSTDITPSEDSTPADDSSTPREGCEDGGRGPGQAPGGPAGEGESTS